MKHIFNKLLVLSAIALTTSCSCGGNNTPTETPTETVLKAKNTTISSTTYEYDYTLNGKIKFAGGISYSPVNITGKVKHSNTAKDGTNHFEKREASGLLVIDSTTYKYNDGNAYITVSSNENKDFSVADASTISQSYDFENNSVGKVFKSLQDNGNVTATKDGDKYKLDLKTNFASDSILSIANFLDSTKIINVLNKYLSQWHLSVNPECYITLNSDNKTVKTFSFSTAISIASVADIELSYTQNFSKLNQDITFEKPSFENTIIDKDQINTNLDEIKKLYDNSKNSYYTYALKTAVDHGMSKSNPLGCAVNSTSEGYAERTVNEDGDVYFHNSLEFKSDYKNDDQYPEFAKNYKYVRANVSSDEYKAYDVDFNTLKKDVYYGLKDYDNHAVDDYYMLPDSKWFSTDNIKIMRKTTDTKKNVDTYKLGITSDTVLEMLKHYNKSIRIDPTGENWVDVYQGFTNFKVKKAEYIIKAADNKINSIELNLKGLYDMAEGDDVKFGLNLDINFDYSQDAYTIPKTKEDIKNK